MADVLDSSALLAAGRAAWPAIHVPDDVFARFVAERLVDADGPVADLPAGDLYLACACASGDPRAIASFERCYFADIDAAVARMGATGSADDIKQILRARFFVAAGDQPPAIAEFSGRGNLHGWVRVSAVREVLRIFKKQQRTLALEEALLEDLAAGGDPETAALKRHYRGDFVAAFREALAALTARDRTLLRYQVVDGLGSSAIGAIYQVHRATAARWLAKVRAQLVEDTQRRLGARLHLSAAETESLIRMVRSQLDISIVSLLQEP